MGGKDEGGKKHLTQNNKGNTGIRWNVFRFTYIARKEIPVSLLLPTPPPTATPLLSSLPPPLRSALAGSLPRCKILVIVWGP